MINKRNLVLSLFLTFVLLFPISQNIKVDGPEGCPDDFDCDGLTDTEEPTYGTDPNNSDTDGDTLIDGDEIFGFFTNPLSADTDNDGLTDYYEYYISITDPNRYDTDGGSCSDGSEWDLTNNVAITDPNNPVDDSCVQPPTGILYCDGKTIDQLLSSGTYNIIDNRGGPSKNLKGTKNADLFLLGDNGDKVEARDGNDCVIGGAGNDKIKGGKGLDQIFGQGGNDKIGGGQGADKIFSGDGDDKVTGGKDNDVISGDNGADKLHGNRGEDIINGGDGNDKIHGGQGNDTIAGDIGTDLCHGGKGTDNSDRLSCETVKSIEDEEDDDSD